MNIHSGFCLLGWTLTNIPVQVSDLTVGGKVIGVYVGGGIALLSFSINDGVRVCGVEV